MTYKEFLQALADAYRATHAQVGDGDAFMCILLDYHGTMAEERIVASACNINWEKASHHIEALKQRIYEIENAGFCCWKTWAKRQYPECQTTHECRAKWLQILADEA